MNKYYFSYIYIYIQIKLALDKVLSLQRIGMANQLPYRLDEFIQPLAN